MTDWTSIRTEYENGASYVSLAKKYDLSRQAIMKHARKENWVTHLVTSPLEKVTSVTSNNIPDQGIADLANYLNGSPEEAKLTLTEHKLFADAYTQYRKAKMLEPAGDQEENSHHDMRRIIANATPEESITIRPALPTLHAISQRLQAEDQGNITPIRKLS